MFNWIILVVTATAAANCAAQTEWSISSGGNGHFYETLVVNAGVTHSDAVAIASSKGGYLATITSKNENEFVFKLIADSQFWNIGQGPWLGGQWNGSEWVWPTGEPWTYSNFAPGQPSWPGLENYLNYTFDPAHGLDPSAFWNDHDGCLCLASGTLPIALVVEYAGVPAPSGVAMIAIGMLLGTRRRRRFRIED